MKVVDRLVGATDTIRELVFIYLLILCTSATAYSYFETKSVFDGFWWAAVTAMTIGYGDTYPVTLGGRIVAFCVMHAVPLLVIPLITARMSSKLIVNSDVFSHDEQEGIKTRLAQIESLLRELTQEKV